MGNLDKMLKFRYLKLGEMSPKPIVCHIEKELESKSHFPGQ